MNTTKPLIALISGSNGFIGKHLVRELQQRAIQTVSLPREFLYNSSLLTRYFADVRPDYIFHLAAYGNMPHQENPWTMIEANVTALCHMLFASKVIPYKGFVNVSSSSVNLPMETFYSATKASGERLVKAFVDQYDKPIVNFRPYSVYGPQEADFRFIPTVFYSCLRGQEMELSPEAMHDWVYVDNLVADMVDCAITAGIFKGEARECGTGVSTSNKKVVKMIERMTGKRANISGERQLRSFDTQHWVCDKPMLKYTKLREGLKSYYESLKAR